MVVGCGLPPNSILQKTDVNGEYVKQRLPVLTNSVSLHYKTETTVDEMNDFMREVANYSPLRRQIDYSNSTEVVSSDFVGSRRACVFDGVATKVSEKNVVLYCWYDNEFGYSCQVMRILEDMAGVSFNLTLSLSIPTSFRIWSIKCG